jgi:sugar phosphate isomerase/epimerase
MAMNRRTFLGTMTAATLIGTRLSWAAADHKLDKIGVQLYTVRDDMKKDFSGTLAKVAQIGYREVEFAGLFDHPAKEVRAMLDHNGLTAPSSHVPYESLGANWAHMLEDAKTLGQSYIVCPSVDESVRNQPDGWKQAADAFNRAGEASKKMGIQFGYHNHTPEFQPTKDGKLPYDILLTETDPKLVTMEMDLYWITKAGQDPLKYFDNYRGRFALVHVKDMKKDGSMTSVGDGTIDFKKIFAASDKAGIKHYFVEHDEPKSPLDDIRSSFQYLSKLRF